MCEKTGKASWIPSFQKSPRLYVSKTPQCSSHVDYRPASPTHQIRSCLAEVEYDTAESALPPYHVWIVNWISQPRPVSRRAASSRKGLQTFLPKWRSDNLMTVIETETKAKGKDSKFRSLAYLEYFTTRPTEVYNSHLCTRTRTKIVS